MTEPLRAVLVRRKLGLSGRGTEDTSSRRKLKELRS